MRKLLFATVLLAFSLALPSAAQALKMSLYYQGPITKPGNVQFFSVAAGDLNGDGYADLVHPSPDGIYVSISDGLNFINGHSSPWGTTSENRALIGDVNGDDKADIVTNDNFTADVYPGTNAPNGLFNVTPVQTYAPGALGNGYTGTILADVNGDGRDDLITGIADHSVDVALGQSDGTFSRASGSPIALEVPGGDNFDRVVAVAAGNFDSDPAIDLAAAVSDLTSTFSGTTGVHFLSGAGDGTFTEAGDTLLTNRHNPQMVTGDLDGDAFDDLVVTTRSASDFTAGFTTLLGGEDGLEVNSNPAGTMGDSTFGPVVVADFDRDGEEDIATGTFDNARIFRGDGDGGFTPAPGSPFALPQIGGVGAVPQLMATADFNGDDAPDLAVLSGHTNPSQARGIYPLINTAEPVASPGSLTFPRTDPGASSPSQSITVTNHGGASANLGAAYLAGANPGSFEIASVNACGSTLEAGETCQFDVSFTPENWGASNARFELIAAGTTMQVALSGDAGNAVKTVTPQNVVLGNVLKGSLQQREIVVESTGTAPVAIAQLALANGNWSIAGDTCSNQSVDPGESCTVTVTANTNTLGIKPSELFGTSNAGNVYASLSANVFDAHGSISPASHDFGEAMAGSFDATNEQTFEISSNGTTDLEIQAPKLTGPNKSSFSLQDEECFTSVLEPGESCEVSVIFQPTSAARGEMEASLTVDTNNATLEAELTGTATYGEADIATGSDFGPVRIEGGKATRSLTLESTGTAPLYIFGFAYEDPDDPDADPTMGHEEFSVDLSDCPEFNPPNAVLGLAPGETCDIEITFDPVGTAGSRSARAVLLAVPFVYEDLPRIDLTGTAIDPEISPDPGSVEFGDVNLDYSGDLPPNPKVELGSAGTTPLEISDIALTGPAADAFNLTKNDNCLDPIDPGLWCGMSLTIDGGLTPGVKTAKIVVTSNATDEPLEIPVTATLVTTRYELDPATRSFGGRPLGSGSPNVRSVTVRSTGNRPVSVEMPVVEGPDASDFSVLNPTACTGPIDPNATCSIDIAFDPKGESPGQRSATLVVGNRTAALTGTALPSEPDPAAIRVTLASPGKVKRGKILKVKAKVTNTGGETARSIVLRTAAKKTFARAPKPVRISSIAPGASITKVLKVKVKKTARKGKKLVVTVIPSLNGKKQGAKKRTVRIR